MQIRRVAQKKRINNLRDVVKFEPDQQIATFPKAIRTFVTSELFELGHFGHSSIVCCEWATKVRNLIDTLEFCHNNQH